MSRVGKGMDRAEPPSSLKSTVDISKLVVNVNALVPVVPKSQGRSDHALTNLHVRRRRDGSSGFFCSPCFLEIRRFEAGFV